MLENPFKVRRAPHRHEMFALELLSAACSDDLHGTNYFEPLIIQAILKKRAVP